MSRTKRPEDMPHISPHFDNQAAMDAYLDQYGGAEPDDDEGAKFSGFEVFALLFVAGFLVFLFWSSAAPQPMLQQQQIERME